MNTQAGAGWRGDDCPGKGQQKVVLEGGYRH